VTGREGGDSSVRAMATSVGQASSDDGLIRL